VRPNTVNIVMYSPVHSLVYICVFHSLSHIGMCTCVIRWIWDGIAIATLVYMYPTLILKLILNDWPVSNIP